MGHNDIHIVLDEADRENEIWGIEYEINRVMRGLKSDNEEYRKVLEQELRLIHKWKRDSEELEDVKES